MNSGVQSEHVRSAIKKKWELMLSRYEFDPNQNFRASSPTRDSIAEIASQRRIETPKEHDAIIEPGLDPDDIRVRLDEVTRSALKKGRAQSYGDGTALLPKAKKDEGIHYSYPSE